METIKHILPNNYEVEILPHTKSVIYEIWNDLCYERDYIIQKGDVVIDIGANQGIFSLFAAYRGAVVYAIEPDAKNYQLLLKNINKNGLNDKINPMFCAINQREGPVFLFSPKGEIISPSSFATTSITQIKTLSKLKCEQVSESVVKAISLSSLLHKIKSNKISLLKIDTEGAELDILTGANYQDLKRVEHIVMEIHAAYSEQELFYLVRNLGYEVVTYEKCSGIFKTGYLYAEHCSLHTQSLHNKKRWTRPVAVMSIPVKTTLGNTIVANAEQSFSTVYAKKKNLSYRFTIDKTMEKPTDIPKKNIIFTDKGPHNVLLEVFDNGISEKVRQKDEANKPDYDSIEKIVWVFSQDYGPALSAIPIKVMGKRYEFIISPQKDFLIPAHALPKDWEFSSLCLGISILDIGDNPDSSWLILNFNGEEQKLTQSYQELFLPGFPRECDLCFSIKAKVPIPIRIQWFTKQDPGIEPPLLISCKKNNTYEMKKETLDHICQIHESASFIIHKELFPKTWRPSRIKLCIAVHPSDPGEKLLEGIIAFNNNIIPLDGLYKEICLCSPYTNHSLKFDLTIPGKRVYQLVWWPE